MSRHAPVTRGFARSLTSRAADLLDGYGADSPLFLASPSRTLATRGVHARFTLTPERPDGVEHQLCAQFGALGADMGDRGSLAVGAVPFQPRAPFALVVPAEARWAGALGSGLEAADPIRGQQSYKVRAVPEASSYLRAVETALAELAHGPLRKVVLARSLELLSERPFAVPELLRSLARRNPNAYVFAADLAQPGGPQGARSLRLPGRRTLLGASPELLLSRSGLEVSSCPLAGSVARSLDPDEDRRRAAALLRSPKDLKEHAFVAEGVASGLAPFCRDLYVPERPSLVATPAMWHLASPIRGRLKDSAPGSLALALSLHPTPAVCGSPTERALAAIARLEGFDRGYYAGMVGWCNAAGDGDWVLSIRCGEVEHDKLVAFAGAGIVEDSTPEAELSETSAKLRTILSALGVDAPAERPRDRAFLTATEKRGLL